MYQPSFFKFLITQAYCSLIFISRLIFQFMGVEIPASYGGAEAGFFSVAIIVEELAKIDPSVSVMCDVQNTLVAPILFEWGTEAQKKKYLPRLHKDMVCFEEYNHKVACTSEGII